MPHFHADRVPDPDTLPFPLVGLAIDAPAPHDSGLHAHQRAQLLYAVSGVLQITVGRTRFVLPPTMAAWIPGGVVHSAQTNKPFVYRSLYLDPDAYAGLPGGPRVVDVNPLLRELVVRAATWPLQRLSAEQDRLVAVLLDELARAPEQTLSLPLPQDRRLQGMVDALLHAPGLGQTLEQLAARAGASCRTVNRLFRVETGLSFAEWRQQLKVMEASRRLAEGESVTAVAEALSYAQESAFIAMFRKAMGVTPGQFRRQRAGGG